MNSHLRNKLQNYAVMPPGKVWDRIEEVLDDEVNAEFPAKLYELEIQPPSISWNKITEALDHDVPFIAPLAHKRFAFPILRYAVAASLIGIVGLVVLWLVNKNIGESDVAKKESPAVASPDTIFAPLNPSRSASTSPKVITGKSFSGDDVKWLAKVDFKIPKTPSPAGFGALNNRPVELSTIFSQENFEEKYSESKSPLGTISYDPSKIGDDNPYILFLNPDGYVVRLSKKIANMIGCVYNEADDNNPGCKVQLKNWREKIAQSSITPSPGNFLDIVELVKTIRENHP